MADRLPTAHLVQLDIAWEDREENFLRVDRLLTRADVRPGDLVVLPEMFDTGFSLNTETTADRDGLTLRYLLRLADDLGCTVHGARTVRDCDCTHAENRATVIGGGGDGGRVLADYAKIHPFSFAREPERFVGGQAVTTYPWTGPHPSGPHASGPHSGPNADHADAAFTCCPAVCYDLRFPELFRLGLLAGAEAFVLGANWPAARAAHWRALAIARAIENQAFVLAVNRAGRDPYLAYAGGSIVVGPQGEVMGELGPEPGVLSVPIDRAAVLAWRSTFPAWRDIRLINGVVVGGVGGGGGGGVGSSGRCVPTEANKIE